MPPLAERPRGTVPESRPGEKNGSPFTQTKVYIHLEPYAYIKGPRQQSPSDPQNLQDLAENYLNAVASGTQRRKLDRKYTNKTKDGWFKKSQEYAINMRF